MTQRDPSGRTGRTHFIAWLVVLLALGVAGPCLADQLQWNPFSVCQAAAEIIGTRSLLVSFCSLATRDGVELWLVTDLEIAATSAPALYELIVSGRRLFRSDSAFSSDEFPVPEEQWTFHRLKRADPFSAGGDLAYLYIHVGGGSFRCLARVLGLDCVVGVEILHLPPSVVEQVAASHAERHSGLWSPDRPSGRSPFSGDRVSPR